MPLKSNSEHSMLYLFSAYGTILIHVPQKAFNLDVLLDSLYMLHGETLD